MDYRQLNQLQRKKMDNVLDPHYVMEWEDSKFMDILMGNLPEIRHMREEKNAASEISALEKLFASYNAFTTDKESFLNDVRALITSICAKEKYWFGINEYEVEECMRRHEFCLISGEGGIGKSFFIRKFEDELESAKIQHLCIYGKFEKDTSRLDIQNIIDNSSQGFVFVVDAINEMSEKGQHELLSILSKLKKYPTIRIVATYRSNSLSQDILEKYTELSKSEYTFPGVSFESALDLLLTLPVPDSQRYEDILYSNNALLLNMLKVVLQDKKVTDESEKGIASVTYILEQYIKKATPKLQKGMVGRQIWLDTKSIAKWMYEQETDAIDEKTLLSLIQTGTQYISVMSQIGFLSYYKSGSEIYFYFVIELLMNYLIARALLEDIQGKSLQEQAEIIKRKAKNSLNMEEAITVAIFDALSSKQGYAYIKALLSETGLLQTIQYSTLVKVCYDAEHIQDFLKVFTPANPDVLLEEFGGYANKPFNCTNFLRNYYLKDQRNKINLSIVLEGTRFHSNIQNRLKNILYVITLDEQSGRDEEAYNFSLLCSAAPNKAIRCLASKILYTLCSKTVHYQRRLLEDYQHFTDYYIRETIIYVLSLMEPSDTNIRTFFAHLIVEEPDLVAKSIKRIAVYLGDEYGYIRWQRRNLYQYVPDSTTSKFLDDILWKVTILDKYALPFQYWGNGDIRSYTKFLREDKQSIHEINRFLEEKYSCVRTGKCQGSSAFEAHLKREIGDRADFSTLDQASMLRSLGPIMETIFTDYAVTKPPTDTQDFENSLYLKCVDIAIGLFYGSLMCNYYANEFATYNNSQESIGYEVYDPLEYGEEIRLASPIPVYQDFIEKLNNRVLDSIELPDVKDVSWVQNAELTRRNILNLLKPLTINGETWCLLAGRISIHGDNKDDTIWKDTYDIWCCTSEEETIRNDDRARYLTIELLEYQGNLSTYENCREKPWLCKDVNGLAEKLNVLDDTHLVLPPAEIIHFLNLSLNVSDMSWRDSNQTKVIVCNNNKASYYRDPIGGTVFIRKDFLDQYVKNHPLKYFAFAERYIKETGFADETSLHFEMQDGQIIKEILNNGRGSPKSDTYNPLCDDCPFGFEEEKIDYSEYMSKIQELLNLYSDVSDQGDESVKL